MTTTLRAGDSINLTTGVVTRQDVRPELRRNDLRALATVIRNNRK